MYAESFTNNSNLKWLSDKICQDTGPVSYIIELLNGNTVRCHVNHTKAREQSQEQQSSVDTNWDYVDSDATEQSTDTSSSTPTTNQ